MLPGHRQKGVLMLRRSQWMQLAIGLAIAAVPACSNSSTAPDMAAAKDMASTAVPPDLSTAAAPPDLLVVAPPDLGPPTCIGAGVPDVNQSQGGQGVPLLGTDVLGQAFTVGATGVLDRIAAEVCPQPGAPAGNYTLTVFNGTQSLGSKTLATAALSCNGPTSFDVCIPVTKGQSLRFEVKTDIANIACMQPPGMCPGTGAPCSTDAECNVWNSGDGAGLSPKYTVNGDSTHSRGELVFQTFIE
jgi:hypothetical protein